MRAREAKPNSLLELSTGPRAYSTFWLLEAIRRNGVGKLYSFDIHDAGYKRLKRYFESASISATPFSPGSHFIEGQPQLEFILGDAKQTIAARNVSYDFLFIDTLHDPKFTQWYVKEVFLNSVSRSDSRSDVFVAVHDVYSITKTSLGLGMSLNLKESTPEGKVVLSFINALPQVVPPASVYALHLETFPEFNAKVMRIRRSETGRGCSRQPLRKGWQMKFMNSCSALTLFFTINSSALSEYCTV